MDFSALAEAWRIPPRRSSVLTTVLTGRVIDQAHLHGLIQRTQKLGLELISIGRAGAARVPGCIA